MDLQTLIAIHHAFTQYMTVKVNLIYIEDVVAEHGRMIRVRYTYDGCEYTYSANVSDLKVPYNEIIVPGWN